MRLVTQETDTDCGPAAVATLCDVTLSDACEFIYGRRGRKGVTSSGCLIEAIRKFGREPLENRCRSLGDRKLYDLKNDALLGVWTLEPLAEKLQRTTNHKWKSYGHWAVWDSKHKAILDPYMERAQMPIYVHKLVEVR